MILLCLTRMKAAALLFFATVAAGSPSDPGSLSGQEQQRCKALPALWEIGDEFALADVSELSSICIDLYVIGWSAVVFGINSTSNAGRKE